MFETLAYLHNENQYFIVAFIYIFLTSEHLLKLFLATALLGSCSIDAPGEAVSQGVRGSHGSKVPFSSHHIQVCGQHDLPLLMVTLLSKL